MFNININSAAKYLGAGFINPSFKTDEEEYIELDVSDKKPLYQDINSNKNFKSNSDKKTIPAGVSFPNFGAARSQDSKEDSRNTFNEDRLETASGKKLNSNWADENSSSIITRKKLQEAVIWSEIIREPLCKRRKRRGYGD